MLKEIALPPARRPSCTLALLYSSALALVLGACAPSATEPADNGGLGDAAVQTLDPEPDAVAAKSWTPAPFDAGSPTLAINDEIEFFEAFWANSQTLEKGEFETAAEHAERTSGAAAFGPFSPYAVYALDATGKGHFQYDADAMSFTPLSIFCHGNNTVTTMDDQHVSCFLNKVVDIERTYPAQNAFGVEAEVTEEIGRLLFLIFPRDSKGISAGELSPYPFTIRCPATRDQAPALKEHLVLAHLIRLSKPTMTVGLTSVTQPTIKDPVSRSLDVHGIEAELVGQACYDGASGALLHHELF